MADPYLGDIMIVGFGFAPRGFVLCEGQILPINQYQALYSLTGTTFGGDGRSTFGLPDLRGRTAIGVGQGSGLSNRQWGQKLGTETNSLTTANLPRHLHTLQNNANEQSADQTSPDGNQFAEPAAEIYSDLFSTVTVGPTQTNNAGGNVPVNNMQPWLALNHAIAVQGVFPARN